MILNFTLFVAFVSQLIAKEDTSAKAEIDEATAKNCQIAYNLRLSQEDKNAMQLNPKDTIVAKDAIAEGLFPVKVTTAFANVNTKGKNCIDIPENILMVVKQIVENQQASETSTSPDYSLFRGEAAKFVGKPIKKDGEEESGEGEEGEDGEEGGEGGEGGENPPGSPPANAGLKQAGSKRK